MRSIVHAGNTTQIYHETPNHNHSVWEVVYYYSGSGVNTINGVQHFFEAGSVLIIPPGMMHHEASVGGFQNIHILFTDYAGNPVDTLRASDNESRDLLGLFSLLHKTFHLKHYNWYNVSEGVLHTIHQWVVASMGSVKNNPYIEKIKSVIISNLSNPIFDINHAFLGFSLSPSYLKKLFIQCEGMTPLKYITQKRIEYAKRLLETRSHGKLQIMDIARMSGFSDQYYFSRIFRKKTGFSPSEWKPDGLCWL